MNELINGNELVVYKQHLCNKLKTILAEIIKSSKLKILNWKQNERSKELMLVCIDFKQF